MAEKKPVSYQDPYWQNLAANAEEKHGLPAGSLRTILTHGERSNANQVSEKGARTVFQIIPATRSAILKNYGIDAYLSDENAADGAALLFKEALNRNNNDPIMAAREYHGGTDRSNWGPVNRDYAKRYAEGLAAFRSPKEVSILDKYNSGSMSDAEKSDFEDGVRTGRIIVAPHIQKKIGVSYEEKKPRVPLDPQERAQFVQNEFNKWNDQRLAEQAKNPTQDTSLYGKAQAIPRAVGAGLTGGALTLGKVVTKPLEWMGEGRPDAALDATIESARRGAYQSTQYYQDSKGNIVPVTTDYEKGNEPIAAPVEATAGIIPMGGAASAALKGGARALSTAAETVAASPKTARALQAGAAGLQGAGNVAGTAASTAPADLAGNLAFNVASDQIERAGGGFAEKMGGGLGAAVGASILTRKLSPNNLVRGGAVAQMADETATPPPRMPNETVSPPTPAATATTTVAETPTATAEDIVRRVADEGVTSGDMIPPTPEELATATQQVQRKIDYATANKEVVVAAINGDRKALDRLAQEANIDEETLKAFEDLGVLETPAPVVSKNVAVKQVGQAAAAAPQSQAKMDYTNFIDETRRAVEDVAASGGKDLATVSTRVRDKLVEVETALKENINKGYDDLNEKIAQASPEGHASFEIETPSVNKLIADEQTKLGTVNKKTGEWQPASANVLDKSYRSMLQRFAEGRTFARVDQMRKEIGAAMQGQGLFKDASAAFRSRVYRALTEDLDAAAEKMGFVDDVRALKDSVIEQKGLQDNITKVFGDTLDRDFVSKMRSLTKDVTTTGADNAKFKALMDMMPTPEMRAEALNATLYQSLTRRGGDVVQWGTFDQLWSNLHNLNPAGVSMFKKYLGEAAYNRWDAIGKVAKAISNFDQGVSRTGASLSTRLDQEANMVRGIAGKAVQAVAGALAARAGAGAIGSTVSRGALALFDKVIPERNLEALAKMINSRAFLTAALSKTAKERSFHLNNLARGKMASAIFNGKPTEKDMEALIPNLKGVK